MIELREALRDAIWYNGLNVEVRKWAENLPDQFGWENDNAGDGQLQLIWMICILMFGNYGTTPKYGWIEDIEGFRLFINRISGR